MGARAWAWCALLVAAAGARELDPAACAARFRVQRDKIIRTEESREMGARYLSELDVGTRAECLRLCCETDSCDVFVYEEKGPGSCYLFKCGPPEDFRCKFTAHGNFSSGVMAVSRRLAELQDQEQLAHHERELASLRSGAGTTPRGPGATAPAPPAPEPAAPAPAPARPPQTAPPRRCSRYQFECRRGGECIAVYNACDGVPQCADGSDEAPELGCPQPAHAPTPRVTSAPPAPALGVPYRPPQESPEAAESVGAEAAPPAERWPHRLTQAQPQTQHRYDDGGPSSHIFSHKGGLLQEVEPAQYPPFEPPWPRAPWPHQSPALEGSAEERGWVGPGAGGGGYWEADPRRAWPVPQPRPEPVPPIYIPPKTMPEVPVLYSSRQQTLRDSPKKGFELARAEPTEGARAPPSEERPAAAPPAALETTTGRKAVGVEATDAAHRGAGGGGGGEREARAQAHRHPAAAEEPGGLSERPPAAVLLLVIGVLMTAVMGAMLGCRARAARRRLRRGKAPFAHDADYLVNGMYL